jgi:hypothetical protein
MNKVEEKGIQFYQEHVFVFFKLLYVLHTRESLQNKLLIQFNNLIIY